MDIFSIFTLCGGLAFFLYGITVMSSGLEKIAGGRLERILKQMTANPIKALIFGAGITAAVQSSSAVTVMLVGLVNSGIMKLSQAIGVIMGSNVGTTITAWILSLSGIQSTNFFIRLLKPESFSPLMALAGVIMMMAAKSSKRKNVGTVLVGFAILMFGMEVTSDSMSPLAGMPEFQQTLMMFHNPIFGVFIGAVVTAIIQSSAASIGILQALSMVGGMTYGMAIPIVMGQNIGTCISAVLSCLSGVSTAAKRVAAVHVVFNILGTVILLSGYYLAYSICKFSLHSADISPFGIAVVHSIFSTLYSFGSVALAIYFSSYYLSLCSRISNAKYCLCGFNLHFPLTSFVSSSKYKIGLTSSVVSGSIIEIGLFIFGVYANSLYSVSSSL